MPPEYLLLVIVVLLLCRSTMEPFGFSVQDTWLARQVKRAKLDVEIYQRLFGLSAAAKRQNQLLLEGVRP